MTAKANIGANSGRRGTSPKTVVLVMGLTFLCLSGLVLAFHRRHAEAIAAATSQPILCGYSWSQNNALTLLAQPTGSKTAQLMVVTDGKALHLGVAVRSFGWSPNGRYLLFSRPDARLSYLGRLFLYDSLRHIVRPVPGVSALTWSACWLNNSTVCYFTGVGDPLRSVMSRLVLSPVSGGVSSAFLVPGGLLPGRVACSAKTGDIVFLANIIGKAQVGKAQKRRWLYTFRSGHFMPVPETGGCSTNFTVSPTSALAVVAFPAPRTPEAASLAAADLWDIRPTLQILLERSRVPDLAQIWQENFSPDGRLIALTAVLRSRANVVFLYDLASGRLDRVTNGTAAGFTPDSKRISYVGEGGALYTCDLHGGDVRKVFDPSQL